MQLLSDPIETWKNLSDEPRLLLCRRLSNSMRYGF